MCNYETTDKSNFNHHAKSKKHLFRILEENKTNELKDEKIKELEEKIKELEKTIIKLTVEKEFILTYSSKIKVNKLDSRRPRLKHVDLKMYVIKLF